MKYKTSSVYILNVPYHIDRLYTYYIPDDLKNDVLCGSIVTVPFGGGNKHVAAMVYELSETDDIHEIKPIISVSSNVTLSDEEIKLSLFLKDNCFCTVGDAIKAIVPSVVMNKVTELYKASDKPIDETSIGFGSFIVYQFVRDNGPVSLSAITDNFTDDVLPALKALVRHGYIEVSSKIAKPTNIKNIEYLTSVYDEETVLKMRQERKLRTDRQAEILMYLANQGSVDSFTLKKNTGATSEQIRTLVARGFIKSRNLPFYRDSYSDSPSTERPENNLSQSQINAFEALSELFMHDKPEAALLHGVTGSGKTRVIISLIDKAISEKKQVILLVPEIGLTPQTIGIFRAFYKDRAVVWHSSLSAGERYDAYRKIASGEADICIGTRSAIFAPFKNLGLIIIDEEHEHTYKSEQTPRYNTVDVARYRAVYNNALLLLASATPSLESYYKAKKGTYHLIELTERYGGATLPETVICDLRVDSSAGNISPLGESLKEELAEVFDKKEQSILFMNRRGYHNFLICVMCGQTIECPHCSVALTVHGNGRKQKLVCHYCGYTTPMPEKCPTCTFEGFRPMGYGTQRVEEALKEEFPASKTLRMDADTTSSKFSYDKILAAFRNKEADVLLGTQMVTKGHDFPDVTLVGVVLADTMLHLDDYAANERAFSLITQVIGRAGRSKKSGKAIIQTYSADSKVLMLAATQDYISFYNDEIERRRALTFPPFCDLALVLLTSSDEALLKQTALEYERKMKHLLSTEFEDVKLVLFGPFEASVYKINEVYRMKFLIKCRSNKRTRALLAYLMQEISQKKGKKLTISTDINPNTV